MDKLNLTIEQKQAAAILENYFNNITILCDWIYELNNIIVSDFFTYDFQDFPRDLENLDKITKNHLSEIINNYNQCQLYFQIANYILDELKNLVDNIVTSVYK